jgi:hypothetical protein
MLDPTGIRTELVTLNHNIETLISIFERYLNINVKDSDIAPASPDMMPAYYDDLEALKAELEIEAKKSIKQ